MYLVYNPIDPYLKHYKHCTLIILSNVMIEKYDSAIKTYEMSLKVFPSGISAHQNLGIVYEKQKTWDKARTFSL